MEAVEMEPVSEISLQQPSHAMVRNGSWKRRSAGQAGRASSLQAQVKDAARREGGFSADCDEIFHVGSEVHARGAGRTAWHRALVVDCFPITRSYAVIWIKSGKKEIAPVEDLRRMQDVPQGARYALRQAATATTQGSVSVQVFGESNLGQHALKLELSWSTSELEDALRTLLSLPLEVALVVVVRWSNVAVPVSTAVLRLIQENDVLQVLTPPVWEASLLFRSNVGGQGCKAVQNLPAWPGQVALSLEGITTSAVAENMPQLLRIRCARVGRRCSNDVTQSSFFATLEHQVSLTLPLEASRSLQSRLLLWVQENMQAYGLKTVVPDLDEQVAEASLNSAGWGNGLALVAAVESLNVGICLVHGDVSDLNTWCRMLYPRGKGPGDQLPLLYIALSVDLQWWSLEATGFVCFAESAARVGEALSIQFWNHKKPREEVEYFNSVTQDAKSNVLAVGVTFYNEEPEELHRTLVSLGKNRELLQNDGVAMQILCVGDGFKEMSPAMFLYLKALFCQDDASFHDRWDDMQSLLRKYQEEMDIIDAMERAGRADIPQRPPSQTFVIERIVDASALSRAHVSELNLAGIADEEEVGNESVLLSPSSASSVMSSAPICLIIKADNRRKHNSGQWIMSPQGGFARAANADFLLLTDCGTLFANHCVSQLVHQMMLHPMMVGCTGRQRVMWAHEQDQGKSFLEGISLASMFRLIQLADYEATYAITLGAFSLCGMLPVLPGPCTMLRYQSLIASSRMDRVTQLHDTEEYQATEMASSPLLSPSSSAGGGGGGGGGGGVAREVPVSPFDHFEEVIETRIDDTDIVIENVKIAEDRIPSYAMVTHGPEGKSCTGPYTTWVSGCGPCGPLFKFQAETEIRSWIAQRRRWFNGAFSGYVWLCLIKPGILFGAPNVSLFRRLMIGFLFFCQLVNYTIACFASSVFACAVHVALRQLAAPFGLSLTVSISYLSLMLLFGWVHHYVLFWKPFFYFIALLNTVVMALIIIGFSTALATSVIVDSAVDTIFLYLGVSILALPFFTSLISLDFNSTWLLLISYIPYVLFIPTLTGVFAIYAISRLGDTSWGNRNSASRSAFADSLSVGRLNRLKDDLQSNAGVALMLLSVSNIVVYVLFLIFNGEQVYLLIALGSLFATTAIQAFLSSIYFLWHHISNLIHFRHLYCCCHGCRSNKLKGSVPK